jgi:RHS repeat-associated protein
LSELALGDVEDRQEKDTRRYEFDGRRIAMSTDGAVKYLAQDQHGNTAYVLDSTGAVVSHTRYYPFGQAWTQESTPPTSPSPTDKMFDGYTKDGTSSGLYYAGARFYSADLGRFLSPDPVGGNYANPQSLNPYSYVRNNPMTLTDPSGACVYDMPRGGPGEGVRGCGLDRSSQPPMPLPPIVTLQELVGGEESAAFKIGLAGAALCAVYCGPAIESAGNLLGNTLFSSDESLEQQAEEEIQKRIDEQYGPVPKAGDLKDVPPDIVRKMGGEKTVQDLKREIPASTNIKYDPGSATGKLYVVGKGGVVIPLAESIQDYVPEFGH